MIISSYLQFKDFCIFFGAGIAIGIIYDLINIPQKINKNTPLLIITDTIFSLIAFVCFWYLTNIINLGEFRLYMFLGYILGFLIQKITLGKLFAKGVQKVYNLLINNKEKFKNSKLGRFLLK